MKSLFDDLPKFCPNCGSKIELDVVGRTSFYNGYAIYCKTCRHKFQFVATHVAEDRLFEVLDPIFTAP